MNSKDIIKQHLEEMAAKDKAFAARFADETKNLDGCMDYIESRAKKEAVRGCAIIEDRIVYGWAAHYYQEESLKDEKEIETKPKQEIATKVSISKKPKAKVEEKKSKYIELDLFGGTL